MSLGIELALTRLALHFHERDPLILYSEFGIASAMIETVTPLLRVADRPLCGIKPLPLACYDRAVDLGWSPKDAGRILGLGPVFVDARAERVAGVMARLSRLGIEPRLLRIRGGDEVPSGFVDILRDSQNALCVRDEEESPSREALVPLSAGMQDEFDIVMKHIGHGPFLGLRHGVGVSALMLDPVSVLDAPDGKQLAFGLGERRAVIDSAGGAALAIPVITSDAPFGVALAGVKPDADVRVVGADVLETGWVGDLWQARFKPAGNVEAVLFEIEAAEGAEITEAWVGIKRRRVGHEDWDEADAQMKLEESW